MAPKGRVDDPVPFTLPSCLAESAPDCCPAGTSITRTAEQSSIVDVACRVCQAPPGHFPIPLAVDVAVGWWRDLPGAKLGCFMSASKLRRLAKRAASACENVAETLSCDTGCKRRPAADMSNTHSRHKLRVPLHYSIT